MDQKFRLTRQDFVNAQPPSLLEDRRQAGAGCAWDDAWVVAPGYELLEAPTGSYLYATPAEDREEWDRWKKYVPLRDEPDLFLKFARMGEEELSTEAVLSRASRYGLLGCGEPAEEPTTHQNAGWFGRPEDGIDLFKDEARRAATALAWYEAVTSGDEDRVMEVIMKAPVVELTYPRPNRVADLSEYQLSVLGSRYWPLSDHYEDVEEPFVALATDYLTWEVNKMIRHTCYRWVKPLVFEDDVRRVVGSWGFTNLLGAMYLQFSWLLEAGILREALGETGEDAKKPTGIGADAEAGG